MVSNQSLISYGSTRLSSRFTTASQNKNVLKKRRKLQEKEKQIHCRCTSIRPVQSIIHHATTKATSLGQHAKTPRKQKRTNSETIEQRLHTLSHIDSEMSNHCRCTRLATPTLSLPKAKTESKHKWRVKDSTERRVQYHTRDETILQKIDPRRRNICRLE